MKNLIYIFGMMIFITSNNTAQSINENITNYKQSETVMNDTTPKVTGIGGIFSGQKIQKKQETGMVKI